MIAARSRAIVSNMANDPTVKYVARLGVRELVRFDRRRGARAVIALVRRNGGSITRAARAAGVHHATLKRWIAALGVRAEIETIRESAGLSPARTLARSRSLALASVDEP